MSSDDDQAIKQPPPEVNGAATLKDERDSLDDEHHNSNMKKISFAPDTDVEKKHAKQEPKSSSPFSTRSRKPEYERNALSMLKMSTKALTRLRRTVEVEDLSEDSSSSSSAASYWNVNCFCYCWQWLSYYSRCFKTTTAFMVSVTALILTMIASYASCDFVHTEDGIGIGIFAYQNMSSDNLECISYTHINETFYFNSTTSHLQQQQQQQQQYQDLTLDQEWRSARLLSLLTLLGGLIVVCLMVCVLWTAYSEAVFRTLAFLLFLLCFLNCFTFVVLKSDICSCIEVGDYENKTLIECDKGGECEIGQGGRTMIAGIVCWMAAAFFLCLVPILPDEYGEQW